MKWLGSVILFFCLASPTTGQQITPGEAPLLINKINVNRAIDSPAQFLNESDKEWIERAKEENYFFESDEMNQTDFNLLQLDQIKKDQAQESEIQMDQIDFPISQKGVVEDIDEELEGIVEDLSEMPAATLSINEDPFEEDYESFELITPSQYDSRAEIRELNPLDLTHAAILKARQSVALVVEKENLYRLTDSIYQLDISVPLKSIYNLCDDVPFQDQPVGGVGTAFIVSETQVITAGHVIERPPSDYVLVFGFETTNRAGTVDHFVQARNIYPLHGRVKMDESLDVILLETARPFDRPPLALASQGSYGKGTTIFMIGHPSGLPAKVAFNARVVEEELYFVYTSLDAFQGNSGSPVFNVNTREVIGILVAGGLDFEWNGQCNQLTTCRIPFCRGEKVLRIEAVEDYLQLDP